MRLSNVILVLSLGGVGAAGALVGCGGDTTSGSTSSGSGGTPVTGDPCSPLAACPQAAGSECISLADNSAAKQFTLRMASLSLTAPTALTMGLVTSVVKNGVAMNLGACYLDGSGAFSWLLQFDTATNKLTTGGAKPTEDPTKGYSFVNETVTQNGTDFMVAPITADAPITDGKFAITTGQKVIVPIYLDVTAKSVVLLPLHDAKLSGTISADHGCIGKFNSKGLDPAGSCVADEMNPAFIGADGKADSDGKLEGYMTLEEADTVVVDALQQSLCVILSGNSTTYGSGEKPVNKCKRDAANKIVFQGDWCDATNDASCKDSIRLAAGFSASGVTSPVKP